ncbi:MAG TPA: hypothetical protein VIH54_17205 [Chthoniobacterales bacterium]
MNFQEQCLSYDFDFSFIVEPGVQAEYLPPVTIKQDEISLVASLLRLTTNGLVAEVLERSRSVLSISKAH